ncbi:hypothetical protein [Haloplanus halophilus]|nr:hypothetical protein [Haloplanus sp. GDY1]
MPACWERRRFTAPEDGIEVVTATGDWPTGPVVSRDYDVTVRRPQVLRGD